MPKQSHGISKDAIDPLLDKLSDMREVLLSIERALERLQTTALRQRKKKSRKKFAPRIGRTVQK